MSHRQYAPLQHTHESSAVYDGSDAVKLTGDQTIAGKKKFTDFLESTYLVLKDTAAAGGGSTVESNGDYIADWWKVSNRDDAVAWWATELNGLGFGLTAWTNQAPAGNREVLWATRHATSGGLTGITYGNATDNPPHTFHGAVTVGGDLSISGFPWVRETSYSLSLTSAHATTAAITLRNSGGGNLGSLYASDLGIGFLNASSSWSWRVDNSGNLTVGTVPWARLSGVPALNLSVSNNSIDNDTAISTFTRPAVTLSRLTTSYGAAFPFADYGAVATFSPDGSSDSYGFQLAADRTGSGKLYYRATTGSSSWRDWGELFRSTSHLVPANNSAWDLGSSTFAFRHAYINGTVELGHATDTSLTRKAAGSLGVEGRAALVMADTGFTQSRVTVSTSAPSGGVDGDVWLKV